MTLSPKIGFTDITIPSEGSVVLIAEDGAVLGASGKALDEKSGDAIAAAAKSARFKAKAASALDLLAPRGLTLSRLLVVGIGKSDNAADWLKAGGAIMGRLQSGGDDSATVIVETASGPVAPHLVAELALGMTLRAYRFDRYKTKKKDEDDKSGPKTVTLAVSDPKAAEAAFGRLLPVAEGVCMARDLVNEPANVLGPVEFADRCEALREAGVEVEILDVPAMEKLGMGALLGVGLGSERPSRLGIMRWNGGGEAQPVAFIGKGVVFDTGGISIKPAGGMEDMKGDMGGAACVVGLMHALAGRKAKVNAVGLVGLVENMPDGKAQRPGDIVTSMSGQTIEIINTDAEGRLVLADVLWYAQDRFKPRFMVNLATLTGAVIVALGHEHAGLFSNDDELSARLTAAGIATGDKVWRLPLAPEYDKMIDSKFADMKNTGGRQASSITAAQFLQRFVNDVPWAHLDVAGTAMGSPQTETNRSWASGWGVRLLDRLVAEHYEG